jgi:hypothetical protein
MSNLTLFKSGNLAVPDYLRQTDDVTKMLAGGGGGKQISIKGGVWRMIVGGEEVAKNEDRAMNMIVVGANPQVNRTFYAGKYEEGKDASPSCWSADGKTPNAEVPAETRQSSSCDKCPQNIAGSGEGTSRACRYSRRLAVVLENDISGNVYRLQLPAKSIFGKAEGDKMPLDAYAKFLAGHGVPITGVVTEARFDTNEAVPVLKFRAVRPLTRDEWDQVQEVSKSDDASRAVEFKMVTTPKKAPEATSQAYQEPESAAAPAAPEPSVRRARPPVSAPAAAPAAGGKPDVKSVLDAWSSDDDAE